MPDDGPGNAGRAAIETDPPFARAIRDLKWPQPLALLRLLLCAHFDAAARVAAAMPDAAWDAFLDLAVERHRVAPSLAAALDRGGVTVPERVAATIRNEARIAGFAALAQRAESLRLAKLFQARSIAPVWLKGWPLAEQLFGAPGLRHTNDMDILVRLDERLEAASILSAEGYLPWDADQHRARLIDDATVATECKDVAYRHPDSGLAIDLHWRTNHFRYWPDLRDLGEQMSDLPGTGDVRIQVPGPVGQLTYLACHGQQHLFSRLKWLLDIARLAELRGANQLTGDLARAEAAGAGRPVRMALHLAGQVFAAPVPAEIARPSVAEKAWADEILGSIADARATPGLLRTRLEFYRWHWRMAETAAQRGAVLRSLTWRPLRLRLAGLARPAG